MSKFKFIMAADPQYGWLTTDDEKVSSGGSWGNSESGTVYPVTTMYHDNSDMLAEMQVKSINALIAAEPTVYGVLFNGDIVNYNGFKGIAANTELGKFKHYYEQIKAPIYCGLGNHDYDFNVDDNNNAVDSDGDQKPAFDMVNYLIQNIMNNNVLARDFTCEEYYEFPSLRTEVTGSLSYSFDKDNVHFVQLNNYPGFTQEWDCYITSDCRRSIVKVKDCYDWLKYDLEFARSQGKAIIICQHQPKFEPRYVELFNQNKVSAVFVGHCHRTFGSQKGSLWKLNCPVYYCGSTSQSTYILLEFDTEAKKIAAVGISSLNGEYKVVGRETIALIFDIDEKELGNPAGYVTFFSDGGYTVEFTLKYKVGKECEEKEEKEEKTGRLLLGNKKTYNLPVGASEYEVSCRVWNGSSWKDKFDTYRSDTPFNCTFRTYGALPNPKMEIIKD